MTKLYIIINTVLEKEQIDLFSFIAVKKLFCSYYRRISLYPWHNIDLDRRYLKSCKEYNIPQNDCCWTIHLFGVLCMESCFWKCMVYVALKVKRKN